MRNEDKLIDAVIDIGTGLKELREEVKGMRKDINLPIDGLTSRVDGLTTRVEKLEINQPKTNNLLSENTPAILKLAERQENTINELKELRKDYNKYVISNTKLF